MFLSDSHLPHLLTPDKYCSMEQHEREIERLFLPAWHCVGQTSELARDGDFKTLELFGYPLILWNHEGRIHAFLNVCSHRHCLLTHSAAGNQPNVLRCQYHGWEYDSAGDTRKIPDARSFKPLEAGTLGLTKYRVATAGQLIFVNLSKEAPSLLEWLGPHHDYLADLFSDRWAPCMTVAQDLSGNWKLLVENVLESYHLEAVHRDTFKSYPPAEACRHEIDDRWTTYEECNRSEHSHLRNGADLVSYLLGVQPEPNYRHLLMYPNLATARMGLFNWAQTVIPVAPNRAINLWRIFYLRGKSQAPWARMAARGLRNWGRKFFAVTIREDGDVLPGVQLGLAAPAHPSGGLISTREERIFHFQQYVLEQTGDEHSLTAPDESTFPISCGRDSGSTCSGIHQGDSTHD